MAAASSKGAAARPQGRMKRGKEVFRLDFMEGCWYDWIPEAWQSMLKNHAREDTGA